MKGLSRGWWNWEIDYLYSNLLLPVLWLVPQDFLDWYTFLIPNLYQNLVLNLSTAKHKKIPRYSPLVSVIIFLFYRWVKQMSEKLKSDQGVKLEFESRLTDFGAYNFSHVSLFSRGGESKQQDNWQEGEWKVLFMLWPIFNSGPLSIIFKEAFFTFPIWSCKKCSCCLPSGSFFNSLNCCGWAGHIYKS